MQKTFSLLLLLVAFNLHAQDNLNLENIPSKKIISKFELVGGPGLLLNYGNDELKDRTFKLGYSVGIGAYHTFTKRWKLNVRALWEKNGNKITDKEVGTVNGVPHINISETESINKYLTFVAQPYLHVIQNKVLIGLGGYYSLLYASNFILASYHNGQLIAHSYSNSISSFKKSDYGLTGSILYSIPFSKKFEATIQIVDKLGIADIRKKAGGVLPEKNHVIFLMVGFKTKK